jgi:hypothetical protein
MAGWEEWVFPFCSASFLHSSFPTSRPAWTSQRCLPISVFCFFFLWAVQSGHSFFFFLMMMMIMMMMVVVVDSSVRT